jgi:hypothetical protein
MGFREVSYIDLLTSAQWQECVEKRAIGETASPSAGSPFELADQSRTFDPISKRKCLRLNLTVWPARSEFQQTSTRNGLSLAFVVNRGCWVTP